MTNIGAQIETFETYKSYQQHNVQIRKRSKYASSCFETLIFYKHGIWTTVSDLVKIRESIIITIKISFTIIWNTVVTCKCFRISTKKS